LAIGWTVIKVGGEVLEGPVLADFAREVRGLRDVDSGALAIVHGGGPQVTELQQRLGQTPKVIAGRRVTDAAALDVLKMVVAGRLNVDLVASLVAVGIKAVGLHGASGPAIRAKKRPARIYGGAGPDPIDLGQVGDVEGFDTDLLWQIAQTGRVPVLACLGADDAGSIFNINADVVASRLATVLGARRLVLVTGAPGVLSDPDDPSSRLPRLTATEARAAIASGTVRGGMIPKIEESLAVLGKVAEVLVVGRLGPGDLARAVREPGSVGTLLTR